MTQAPQAPLASVFPAPTNGNSFSYTQEQSEYIDKLRKGSYDFQWLNDPRPTWGIRSRMRNPGRGLTLQDINDAYAGIPWDGLKTLPDDVERAVCQIATLLTEVEMIASDFPAKWLWQMNQHFHEVKMFLCTQAMDEARHLEVFRKRALANGGGLMRCLAGTEVFLRTILHAPTYIQGSFLMHVLGEGLVLDIFRGGEFLAQNKAEKEIYLLCMQDEARHVSYGTMHLKYFLEHNPDRENALAEMHMLADLAEMGIPGFLTNPFIVEPLAVLMGGGVKHIDRGMDAVRLVWGRMREEYLNRCELGGMARRSRTRIPADPPY